MVKISFISFCAWLSATLSVTQETHLTLRGEIIDDETRLPLAYANVTVIGRLIGTVSNTSGGFEIHLPISTSSDTLAVSFIGYDTYKLCIATAKAEEPLTVAMRPSIYKLDEIVVRDKSYTVHSLLRDVLARYDSNYNTRPYEMEAFYREVRQTGEKYDYLLEAASHLYKASYKTEYRVRLGQIRKSNSTNEYNGENRLDALLKNDYVSNPYSGFYRLYRKKGKYTITDTTVLDHVPVYVVTAGSLPDWKQTFYINSSDFAILRYEGESRYGTDGNQVMQRTGKNTVSRYRYLNVVNTFNRKNGKYYPGYFKMRLDHDEYNTTSKKVEAYKVWEREILINAINYTNVRPMESQDVMKDVKLEDQLKDYDALFWKNYTILTRTPLQEQITRDLEKEATLEEQFRKQKATQQKTK